MNNIPMITDNALVKKLAAFGINAKADETFGVILLDSNNKAILINGFNMRIKLDISGSFYDGSCRLTIPFLNTFTGPNWDACVEVLAKWYFMENT